MSKINRDTDRRCKLNNDQVAEIRHRYMNSKVTYRELAEIYGVTIVTICHIISPRSHKKHLEYKNKKKQI